ncbi:hypothetical protein BD770DRAFT_377876 [Pilaira anomala]|nr:hypothetical protein BD770DRAFT_377876 [Pilaira anomala]
MGPDPIPPPFSPINQAIVISLCDIFFFDSISHNAIPLFLYNYDLKRKITIVFITFSR